MATLLVVNLPPALEEDLIDYLLAQETVRGFTSYHIKGHGEFENLSIAEQVSGQIRRVQFEILLDDDEEAHLVVAGLGSEVGRNIRYWQQSVYGEGVT